jgi:hypothetical protein
MSCPSPSLAEMTHLVGIKHPLRVRFRYPVRSLLHRQQLNLHPFKRRPPPPTRCQRSGPWPPLRSLSSPNHPSGRSRRLPPQRPRRLLRSARNPSQRRPQPLQPRQGRTRGPRRLLQCPLRSRRLPPQRLRRLLRSARNPSQRRSQPLQPRQGRTRGPSRPPRHPRRLSFRPPLGQRLPKCPLSRSRPNWPWKIGCGYF